MNGTGNLHRGEDVVCQRKLPVDEFLLFVLECVAVVDVELALSSVLSSHWHAASVRHPPKPQSHLSTNRHARRELPWGQQPHTKCRDRAPCMSSTAEPEASWGWWSRHAGTQESGGGTQQELGYHLERVTEKLVRGRRWRGTMFRVFFVSYGGHGDRDVKVLASVVLLVGEKVIPNLENTEK